MLRIILSFVLVVMVALPAEARDLRVAVAANFRDAAQEIAEAFTARSGVEVALSVGSTGHLAGQILLGAPFDLFLAADRATPERLVTEGRGASPSTYAIGRLVLITATGSAPEGTALTDARRIAIANPRSAPYGRAAEAYLRAAGLWQSLQSKLVLSQSVSAAFAAVASGAADAGLVALSSALAQDRAYLALDAAPGIEQQALLLSDRQEAAAFMAFLLAPEAQTLIKRYGYGLP